MSQQITHYATVPTIYYDEEAKLSDQCTQLEEERKDIMDRIDVLNSQLEAINVDLMDEIGRIEVDIQAKILTRDQEAKQDEVADDIEFDQSIRDEDDDRPAVEISDKAKKLYRKISSKAHPDRTNNPKLHALFITATEAYRRDDVSTLQAIYSQIMKGVPSTIVDEISAQIKAEAIERLKKRLAELRDGIERLKSSGWYRMLEDWETEADVARSAVIAHHRRTLQARLKQAREILDTLNGVKKVQMFNVTINGMNMGSVCGAPPEMGDVTIDLGDIFGLNKGTASAGSSVGPEVKGFDEL